MNSTRPRLGAEVDEPVGPPAWAGPALQVERNPAGLQPRLQLGEAAPRGFGILDDDLAVLEAVLEPKALQSRPPRPGRTATPVPRSSDVPSSARRYRIGPVTRRRRGSSAPTARGGRRAPEPGLGHGARGVPIAGVEGHADRRGRVCPPGSSEAAQGPGRSYWSAASSSGRDRRPSQLASTASTSKWT